MANRSDVSLFPRRAFLRHAAGAAGAARLFPAIIPVSVLGRAGAQAPSERVTIGMIGVGSHGTGVNLRGFLAQPDARVVAVCDVDARHRDAARRMVDEKYGSVGCSATGDFREVLARADIDAVMISTPDHWHVPIAILALRAGKAVCCEKPTLTIAEGRRLCAEVRGRAAVFQTSTEDRSIAQYRQMAELARNGRLGKIHTIRIELPGFPEEPGDPTPEPVPAELDYDMWLGPAPEMPYCEGRVHYNFRRVRDTAGGSLTDWGTHQLDTAQWANGTENSGPVEVSGTGEWFTGGLYDNPYKFHVEFTYANGVRLFIESGGTGMRIEGERGWVGNAGWRKPLEAEPMSLLHDRIGPGETRMPTCAGGEHRGFLDALREGRDPYNPVENLHGMSTMGHLANIAMELGRKLRWDPAAEEFLGDETANRLRARQARAKWALV